MQATVPARVARALESSEHHADADDTKRLVAFSYTDAAVERLLAQLDATGLSERSLVAGRRALVVRQPCQVTLSGLAHDRDDRRRLVQVDEFEAL